MVFKPHVRPYMVPIIRTLSNLICYDGTYELDQGSGDVCGLFGIGPHKSAAHKLDTWPALVRHLIIANGTKSPSALARNRGWWVTGWFWQHLRSPSGRKVDGHKIIQLAIFGLALCTKTAIVTSLWAAHSCGEIRKRTRCNERFRDFSRYIVIYLKNIYNKTALRMHGTRHEHRSISSNTLSHLHTPNNRIFGCIRKMVH